ncbi:MAG: CotH kinase family protein [Myxococcales bacterium]|nr:CotH kinase family protein [Myxococcales bacterium]
MRVAPLLIAAGFVAASFGGFGCGAALPAEDGVSADEVMGTAFASKEALFGADMLFVRIQGWDPAKMTPATLASETAVPGAELVVYRAKANSKLHCPDSEASTADLAYKTKTFTLRTSGNLTNGTPKSSYKVSLEKKDDRFFGMKKLNLKSMWNDVSQMREALAWSTFREAGVHAPRHTYAKLCVNDRYFGLYSLIEEIDKPFLKDHFGKNDGGNLYKAYWSEPGIDLGPATLGYRGTAGDDGGKHYKKATDIEQRTYRLKTNEEATDDPALQTYDDLATLVRTHSAVGQPGAGDERYATPAYRDALSEVFNVKGFLRWAAVTSLIGAWDNYYATPANYFVYNSGRRGVSGADVMSKPYFTWLPWDYDNSFGTDFFGRAWHEASIVDWVGYDGKSNMESLPLLGNILKNGAFLAYYLDFVQWANDTLLTEPKVMSKVARLFARVERAAYLEGEGGAPAHTGRQFTNDEVYRNGFSHHELRRGQQVILGIKHFVVMRHERVAAELTRLRAQRGVAQGSSGATFPAPLDELP